MSFPEFTKVWILDPSMHHGGLYTFCGLPTFIPTLTSFLSISLQPDGNSILLSPDLTEIWGTLWGCVKSYPLSTSISNSYGAAPKRKAKQRSEPICSLSLFSPLPTPPLPLSLSLSIPFLLSNTVSLSLFLQTTALLTSASQASMHLKPILGNKGASITARLRETLAIGDRNDQKEN